MGSKFNALMKAKANIPVTLAIACLASLVTTFLSQGVLGLGQAPTPGLGGSLTPVAAASSVLECEAGVYSPVQRVCVTQAVFDAEMTRLFSALGIDTSIYQGTRETKEN